MFLSHTNTQEFMNKTKIIIFKLKIINNLYITRTILGSKIENKLQIIDIKIYTRQIIFLFF